MRQSSSVTHKDSDRLQLSELIYNKLQTKLKVCVCVCFSAAVESTGAAKAEAQSRAEAARIQGEAAVSEAKLKAEAQRIEAVRSHFLPFSIKHVSKICRLL